MIYFEFLTKVSVYLKSLRVLKNFVSFDMLFPIGWSLPKNIVDEIQLINNKVTEEGVEYNLLSFVTENKKENIDKIEHSIEFIIKKNIEREEKDKLFQNKIEELKNIFENQELNNLMSLRFDIPTLSNVSAVVEDNVNDFKNILEQSKNGESKEASEGNRTTKVRK